MHTLRFNNVCRIFCYFHLFSHHSSGSKNIFCLIFRTGPWCISQYDYMILIYLTFSIFSIVIKEYLTLYQPQASNTEYYFLVYKGKHFYSHELTFISLFHEHTHIEMYVHSLPPYKYKFLLICSHNSSCIVITEK